jgi:IS30 family transposase
MMWELVVRRNSVTGNGPKPGRYLSPGEREEIALGIARKESFREISRRLGRPVSTVSRAVARNGGAEGYRALAAQARAQVRAQRPKTAKLAGNDELRGWVQEHLKMKWSPERISRQLAAEFPDRPELRVSHETIYQSLGMRRRRRS